MHGMEEIEEKAITLGKRHHGYSHSLWMTRPPRQPASHPPSLPAPKLEAGHFIAKTHWCFEMAAWAA